MTPVATNKTLVVFNRTSDVCQYLKQKKGSDFVMKITYDILSQHGKFAKKCPIEKDTRYYFDDFKLTEDMVPAFIPLVESRNCFTITYLTKEQRRLISIVSAKVFTGIHVV